MNPKILLHPFFVGAMVLLLFVGCSVFSGGGKKEGPETLPSPVEPPHPKPGAKEIPETEKLDFEVKTVNGSLNWSKGLVSAKGYGVPPADAPTPEVAQLLAFQAAKVEAQTNLLELTAGVHITATSTVKDYMVADRVIETKVEGVLKGAKEVKAEFLKEEQMAVVEVAVFLEEIGEAIPQKAIGPAPQEQPVLKFTTWESPANPTLKPFIGDNTEVINAVSSGRNLDEIKESLNNMAQRDEKLLAILAALMHEIDLLKKSQTAPVEPEVEYTGIVVNAAGSKITPHMKPNIYSQGKTATLFYGIGDGRQRDPNLHALAAWEQTLSGAVNNSRVAQTPFVVKAASVSDDKKSLAISEEDARKIEEIEKKYHLLERGRVVIVL